MRFVRAAEFVGQRAWAALDLAKIDEVTARLHWTDAPYVWHVNDGSEVFAVLDGTVTMRVRQDGVERALELATGDVFVAEQGDEHLAEPHGNARVLVVERAGSR